MKGLVYHLRKIALLAINLLLNRTWFFTFLGFLNKRFDFIETVFVAYPAYERYANAYVYKRHRHLMAWKPWPAGVFRQNGKWGITTVISSSTADFYKPENVENLKRLVGHTEAIRRLTGAKQMTFAGILPGVLYGKGLIEMSPEADVTVSAVLKALEWVKEAEGLDKVPIIVLGGEGFIGQKLVRELNGAEKYVVDNRGADTPAQFPDHLYGKKVIVLNLTKRAALMQYVKGFWPGVILVNEVYPEPEPEEIASLSEKQCSAYHIAGLQAYSLPSFPDAYEGGIPCCAGWNSSKMRVLVNKLN